MPISNDDATELIKSLQRASFGPLPSTGLRIIYLENAEAVIWNHTAAPRTPWQVAIRDYGAKLSGENRADSRDASPFGENRG